MAWLVNAMINIDISIFIGIDIPLLPRIFTLVDSEA
jgi:hypothetical protein